MGAHSKPRVTLRRVATVTAAGAGLAVALTGTASADPVLGNCGDPTNTNPDVRVCTDHGRLASDPLGNAYRTTDRVHAIVKVDPLLCVHVIVDPEGNRRLVSTRGCGTHRTPVIEEPCPPCPPGTVPPAAGTCPTPAPAAPATPATPESPVPSSPVEGGSTGPATVVPADTTTPGEAPVPQTVQANLPVTH